MDFWDIITGPLIGALIGYATNLIAVKMLFHPYNPIKIGKWTLPFTPGIVPKRKKHLAVAVGNAVGNRLFTGEDLKDLLLAEETKKKVVDTALDALDLTPAFIPVDEPQQSANSLALTYLGDEKWELLKVRFTKILSHRLMAVAKELNIGEIIASQILPTLSEKKSGMLSLLLNEHTVASFLPTFTEKINVYIDEEGENLIESALEKQVEEYTNRPLYDLLSFADEEQIRNVVGIAYEKLVGSLGKRFSEFIDVASVVRSKMEQMDSRELEKLCMSVLKHELSAVVNLGALIGFLLGALNLVI